MNDISRPVVGRFAPSPTGRMHAGNLYAYLMAWLISRAQNGQVVLRIEDLDVERSRQEYIDLLMRDFEEFGLGWDKGPFYQSARNEAYKEAFQQLSAVHHVYPCFCSRADLKAQSAPHLGEKHVYSGTCRNLGSDERAQKAKFKNPSFRIEVPDCIYSFTDLIQGEFQQNLAKECGDFLIRRSDDLFAYQLAVIVDDAAQEVNCVVRGYDLITSSPQQIFLLESLGFEAPDYAHVPLFVNASGRRLSKRDKDASLDELKAAYKTPQGVLGHIAYIGKIIDREEALTTEDLLQSFNLNTYVTRVKNEVGLLSPIVFE